jgi:YebC/PmpR family DNA-binding regulatory protein
MSGHSKWATTKRQKGVADSRRAKVFTKISNTIAVAARSGADPTMNSKLRMAIDQAKAVRMPKDNIERSIARGAGGTDVAQLESITYEGFAPGGVGIIVEAVTDNRNRTAAMIKHIFTKFGGNLGASGSVAWQFEYRGVTYWPAAPIEGAPAPILAEDQELALIGAGAVDIQTHGNQIVIYSTITDTDAVRAATTSLGETQTTLEWVPKELVAPENPDTVQQLLEALDDEDDVSAVYTNADL